MSTRFLVLRFESHLLAKELDILMTVLTLCVKEGEAGEQSQVARKLNAYASTGKENTTELLVHKTVHLLVATDHCEQVRNHRETLKQRIHGTRVKETGE